MQCNCLKYNYLIFRTPLKININLCVSRRYALTLLVLFTLASHAFAQTLHGTVTDKNTGEPIIGASISLKTTSDAKAVAVSDEDGKFTINVKNIPSTLVISYIGYKKEEINVSKVSNSNLDIHLALFSSFCMFLYYGKPHILILLRKNTNFYCIYTNSCHFCWKIKKDSLALHI